MTDDYVCRKIDGTEAVKKPGMTLAESLGIDTTGQPGGVRVGVPVDNPTSNYRHQGRVSTNHNGRYDGWDWDANWHPEA